MFWGVSILSGRRYTQTVEKSYHISKAVLEIPVDGKVTNKRVQLMLEHNNTHYVLSNLDSEKIVQVDLDLIFTEGEEVTFYLNGEGAVHLSGYVLDFGDEDDFDGEFDEEGISDEESEEEELTNANSKRVIKNADSVSNAKKAKVDAKAVAKVGNGLKIDDSDDDEEDDDKLNILGNLDEEFDSDEEDEEDDEEEDEEDDVPMQAAKPAPKLNGQTPKQQQKGTPAKSQQQKGTPAKGQQQNSQNIGSVGKPNNQTPKGGQPNQNKFGQKGQNSPQGQKPNPNQKGPQQQKGFQQNKQQQFNNNKKGPFTPDQKAGKKLPGGLQVNDLHVGSGPEARKGKFVHVRYVGKLPNNKEFDRSSNKPFSFRLGAGEVIKGWDLGLEGMKVGGKRKIVVPPQMGYGSRSMGVIPANSTLHFDVELVSIS